MRILELAGRPAQMGEDFGAACRAEIAELYQLRLDNALSQARAYGNPRASEAELLCLARACLTHCCAFNPAGTEELLGIARGAGLGAEQVLALNGLTDLRDALAWGGELLAFGGCTAALVSGAASASGQVLFAQTWDLSTDNAPFVCAVHRVPDQGPETWSVTTAGCLSLVGLSERGVAVGTTNLRTLDARPGVPYLSVIHRALRAADAGEAIGIIVEAHRAGAHSFAVADAAGGAGLVECTATRHRVREIGDGVHVQTNHCQVPEHAALEADTPQASSRTRLGRMRELIREHAGRLDVHTLETLLADRANGELAICRDDFAGISTNAAVVIAPSVPSLRACAGPPLRAEFVDLV